MSGRSVLRAVAALTVGIVLGLGACSAQTNPSGGDDSPTTASISPTTNTPSTQGAETRPSPTAALQLTQFERELCAYLTENVVEFRDGIEGVSTGFSAYASGGGGITGPVEEAMLVRIGFEAAKAATEPGALGRAPSRLNDASDISSRSGIEALEALRIGMAVIDVLARCQHHGGWRVHPDPDALARNLAWVSGGGVNDTNRSRTVTNMCSGLRSGLDNVRAAADKLEPELLGLELKVAMFVAWMQTAALYECTELLGVSIDAADALL